ncbi:hypothetical protein [Persicobacter diffluens]|uniref:Uncharacterized protein n=1 Tax=Persicobacter diffluens TaxID=981 RepID=A0AAN5AN32_9BACT|nr:hypothetical protein PEDI_56460 [Persicobacter diffluens]
MGYLNRVLKDKDLKKILEYKAIQGPKTDTLLLSKSELPENLVFIGQDSIISEIDSIQVELEITDSKNCSVNCYTILYKNKEKAMVPVKCHNYEFLIGTGSKLMKVFLQSESLLYGKNRRF